MHGQGKARPFRQSRHGGDSACIPAIGLLFTVSPKANTALPAKPVVELSRSDTLPPGTEAVEMFAAMDRGNVPVRLMPEKDDARLELKPHRPAVESSAGHVGGRLSWRALNKGDALEPVGCWHGGPGFFCFRRRRSVPSGATYDVDESKPEPSQGRSRRCRLEELANQPAVQRLCGMLGGRQTDLRAAGGRVASELRSIVAAAGGALRTLGGTHGTQRFFTPKQIEEGKRLAEVAMQ